MHVYKLKEMHIEDRYFCMNASHVHSPVHTIHAPIQGMDPNARRNAWDVILKFRKNCTVLLSTHHLDEADLLSDRCAIIANGRLRCNGTPLQLKRQYGAGYRLTLSVGEQCQHDVVKAAVKHVLPLATLCDESLNEVRRLHGHCFKCNLLLSVCVMVTCQD
jgi:ABC-type uncharacterized transport system ATPase subunit